MEEPATVRLTKAALVHDPDGSLWLLWHDECVHRRNFEFSTLKLTGPAGRPLDLEGPPLQ